MYTFILKTDTGEYPVGVFLEDSPEMRDYISKCLTFSDICDFYVYDHEHNELHSIQEVADSLNVTNKNN